MILMLCDYLSIVKVNKQKKEKSDAETKTISLIHLDKDSIREITYKNEKSEMTLEQKGQSYVNKNDAAFPVNQDNATAMFKAVTNISAERKVCDKAENIEEYGLNDPSLILKIVNKEGKEYDLTVGMKVPTEEYYYAMLNNDNAIYTISSSIYTSFDLSTSQMIAKEDVPSINASNVTYLSVDNKNKKDFVATKDQVTHNDLYDRVIVYQALNITFAH